MPVATSSTQALQWIANGHFGGVMPHYDAQGKVVGLRKANLFDGIKVALASKHAKAEIISARNQGLRELSLRENSQKLANRVIRSVDSNRIAGSVGRAQADIEILTNARLLRKTLNAGLFSTQPLPARVLRDPTEFLAGVKRPKIHSGGVNVADQINASPERAQWRYTQAHDTNPITRRALNAVKTVFIDPSQDASTKLINTSHASGWAPVRRERIGADGARQLPEGQFSTIITREEEQVPTEFPDQTTVFHDEFDDEGALQATTELRAVRIDQDETRGTANYRLFDGDTFIGNKRFTLTELARHPQNLILEHSEPHLKGYTTVWFLARPELAPSSAPLQWHRTTFDNANQSVTMPKLNADGSYTVNQRMGFVQCEDPFIRIDSERHKKVSFQETSLEVNPLKGVADKDAVYNVTLEHLERRLASLTALGDRLADSVEAFEGERETIENRLIPLFEKVVRTRQEYRQYCDQNPYAFDAKTMARFEKHRELPSEELEMWAQEVYRKISNLPASEATRSPSPLPEPEFEENIYDVLGPISEEGSNFGDDSDLVTVDGEPHLPTAFSRSQSESSLVSESATVIENPPVEEDIYTDMASIPEDTDIYEQMNLPNPAFAQDLASVMQRQRAPSVVPAFEVEPRKRSTTLSNPRTVIHLPPVDITNGISPLINSVEQQ